MARSNNNIYLHLRNTHTRIMQQLRDHVRDLVRYDVLKETTLEATRYT